MLKLPIKLPGKKAFAIDTSKDIAMPALHMLSIAAGTRGSGKSVAVSSLIAHARERDFLDRVILISPTYPSNREIWDVAGIKQEDVYEPTKTVVETLKEFIKQEKQEWDQYLYEKKEWDRYQKLISSPHLNMGSTKTVDDLMLYAHLGFFEQEPVWKYAKGKTPHPPRLICIIDDAMGTELMQGGGSKSGLVRLCIAHRHWSQIGISIIMCVQSWCSKTGVDRSLREQMTNVMLWKVCQEKALERIWSENDVNMPYEQFKKMTDYVWSVPHRFLFIDFAPKKPEMKFRMNFDTLLDPADFSVCM
tara:strand:+ start:2409 stop:3320 length:912 start_codon:yes stop_codon:yes gene_type:complete